MENTMSHMLSSSPKEDEIIYLMRPWSLPPPTRTDGTGMHIAWSVGTLTRCSRATQFDVLVNVTFPVHILCCRESIWDVSRRRGFTAVDQSTPSGCTQAMVLGMNKLWINTTFLRHKSLAEFNWQPSSSCWNDCYNLTTSWMYCLLKC